VSELGRVLELLYGARDRYQSARLEAHERRNHRLQSEAYERAQREQTGAVSVQLYGPGTDVPEESEATIRLWFEQPNRFREERTENGHEMLLVGDGARWWTSSPEWATVVQEGDGWAQADASSRMLLDPALLISDLALEIRGRTQAAGREAVAIDATPRHPLHHSPPLPWGATGHELAVDAERGVLLRVASSLDGVVFDALDVTEIAFDETLDERLFRYEPPPGEEVLQPKDVSPGEPVSVEEAARRASFTVLIPSSLGAGWHVHALYVAGRARIRETVHVSLFREDGVHNVGIRETPAPFERWQLNGTEERNEGEVTLRVSDGGWTRVLVERDGTCVELSSATYSVDELVELALALRPARHERPPLVG
jgi:outer membrane lipoprotein-sorting protein